MGKFDKILKAIGSFSDDALKDKAVAQKLLNAVDSPEISTKLTGPARQKYLTALDVVQGDRAGRAKDLGFDLGKKQYHGTTYKGAIDEFRPSGSQKGDTYKYGEGVYTTPWANYADQYAGHGEGAIYPLHIREKANFNPADENKAKELLDLAGVDTSHRGRLRGSEEGLDLIEKKLGKKNVSSFLDANNHRVGLEDDGIFVSKPSDVRSTNAAFDKRFKDSSKLLAGTAPMASNFGNPLDYIKKAATTYNEAKQKIADPLAGQLDLTKDGSLKDDYSAFLGMALDPVNLVPGAAGVGLGAIEMLGDSPKKQDVRTDALKKMAWGN